MEGEQGSFLLHIPALYLFALLLNRLHIVKNFTWFQFVSVPGIIWKICGKYLLFNPRNDVTFWGASTWMFVANITDLHRGGPEMWFMPPTLWKVKKTQNWQHKQTTAENLSPLTMPFFSLLIPFFISCWFWTAAPVCCLVWCIWQQAACRRERLLAVLSLTAVLVVHKLLSCLPHCATPSGAQTSGGDALVGILLTSKQSTGHITAR